MKDDSLSKYLTEKEYKKVVDEIIAFFLDERGEEIGIIAASEVLDLFESEIVPKVHAKAMKDCKKIVKEQFEQLDFELTERMLDSTF